jgi:hypothetical protein
MNRCQRYVKAASTGMDPLWEAEEEDEENFYQLLEPGPVRRMELGMEAKKNKKKRQPKREEPKRALPLIEAELSIYAELTGIYAVRGEWEFGYEMLSKRMKMADEESKYLLMGLCDAFLFLKKKLSLSRRAFARIEGDDYWKFMVEAWAVIKEDKIPPSSYWEEKDEITALRMMGTELVFTWVLIQG